MISAGVTYCQGEAKEDRKAFTGVDGIAPHSRR